LSCPIGKLKGKAGGGAAAAAGEVVCEGVEFV
jgi:hypothetical protein